MQTNQQIELNLGKKQSINGEQVLWEKNEGQIWTQRA